MSMPNLNTLFLTAVSAVTFGTTLVLSTASAHAQEEEDCSFVERLNGAQQVELKVTSGSVTVHLRKCDKAIVDNRSFSSREVEVSVSSGGALYLTAPASIEFGSGNKTASGIITLPGSDKPWYENLPNRTLSFEGVGSAKVFPDVPREQFVVVAGSAKAITAKFKASNWSAVLVDAGAEMTGDHIIHVETSGNAEAAVHGCYSGYARDRSTLSGDCVVLNHDRDARASAIPPAPVNSQ